MKRKWLLIACFCIDLIHGMNENKTVIDFYNTKIHLSKGVSYKEIGYLDDKVHFIVVGKNEQLRLQNLQKTDFFVGMVYLVSHNKIYIKRKKAQSSSDDDTYIPYDFLKEQRKQDICYRKRFYGNVINVAEPCIDQEYAYWNDAQKKMGEGFLYTVQRINPRISCEPVYCDFHGKDALIEAEKDLALCYNNALRVLWELNNGAQQRRSIAFTPLGTGVGFPRKEAAWIAVKTICEFIHNNQHAYSAIYLLVKKRSEFILYETFIRKLLVYLKMIK